MRRSGFGLMRDSNQDSVYGGIRPVEQTIRPCLAKSGACKTNNSSGAYKTNYSSFSGQVSVTMMVSSVLKVLREVHMGRFAWG